MLLVFRRTDMPTDKMTPEEFAGLVLKNKPHLVEIEDKLKEIDYGEVQVNLTVRAGVVSKMQFWSGNTWLKPKNT